MALREQNNLLSGRIETLEILLTGDNSARSPLTSPSTPPSQPAETPSPPKEKYNALIISDSIFRHVGADCPKKVGVKRALERDIPLRLSKSLPLLKVKKVVIPGARCARLFDEASRLSQRYEFEEVVVHVGTNYINDEDCEPMPIFEEIQQFLGALKGAFKSRITFSPILPRVLREEQEYDQRYEPLSELTLQTIELCRIINHEVHLFCESNSIGSMICPAFIMDAFDPYPDKSLLSRDGVHLSRKGIVRMENCLFDHLAMKFWVTSI